jgi:hypothetical protein
VGTRDGREEILEIDINDNANESQKNVVVDILNEEQTFVQALRQSEDTLLTGAEA